MSELKAETIYLQHESGENYAVEFYLKSEADKVIAELEDKLRHYPILVALINAGKKEIAELKADYKEACGRLQTANLIKDKQLAATHHHKYKRCLAMARVCRLRARWFGDNAFYKKEQWALQWHKRWLEIAAKIKEEK